MTFGKVVMILIATAMICGTAESIAERFLERMPKPIQ